MSAPLTREGPESLAYGETELGDLAGEVVVRMRTHQPTLNYVRRRTAEGKTKREISRCLERFVAREIFGYFCRRPKVVCPAQITA